MNISVTEIEGVLILQAEKIADERGFFSEVYRSDILPDYGVEVDFKQTNHVYSNEVNVLRGLHFQQIPHAQAKLVRVVRGSIYDVVVDLRPESETYGKWLGLTLSDSNWKQVYIPEGFAHGYLTLEAHTEIEYKVSNLYHPESEVSIAWDDESLAIDWPLEGGSPIISDKDGEASSLQNYEKESVDA